MEIIFLQIGTIYTQNQSKKKEKNKAEIVRLSDDTISLHPIQSPMDIYSADLSFRRPHSKMLRFAPVSPHTLRCIPHQTKKEACGTNCMSDPPCIWTSWRGIFEDPNTIIAVPYSRSHPTRAAHYTAISHHAGPSMARSLLGCSCSKNLCVRHASLSI